MLFPETVSAAKIAFLIAALNDLDILSGDIIGAYLNAIAAEKVYTIAGKEFGEAKYCRCFVLQLQHQRDSFCALAGNVRLRTERHNCLGHRQ